MITPNKVYVEVITGEELKVGDFILYSEYIAKVLEINVREKYKFAKIVINPLNLNEVLTISHYTAFYRVFMWSGKEWDNVKV